MNGTKNLYKDELLFMPGLERRLNDEHIYFVCNFIIFNTSISDNKISMPLSFFEKSDFRIARAKNYDYDIAVRKEADGNFLALLMRCTHADNQLTNTGNGFSCSLHGSIFDKDGSVKKGPAEIPLKRFFTEKIGDQLIIHLT